MIRLENIQKVYRTDTVETLALNSISLDIARGEFLSVMGPSGCGKSTLLNIMGLLDAPSRGEMSIGDQRMDRWSDEQLAHFRNQKIGFIFQSYHLINDLRVTDNVELPLLYRRSTAGKRKKMATEALEKVGLSNRVKHFPSQLSGGQKQRVAIARAIVGQPEIILADEPTGNLDSAMGNEIIEILLHLNKTEGTTIVMVTHDEQMAKRTHRLVRLFDGSQVQRRKILINNQKRPYMLKNYFKIAIAVLKRRKFFTFISLFGICFTLTILIVLSAIIDRVVSAGYPDVNRGRELFVNSLRLRSSKNASDDNGGPSIYFLEHYVSKLQPMEAMAIVSHNSMTSSYGSNKKLGIALTYTNDQYWDVLQFRFVEGGPYGKQAVASAERVAVITTETRDRYFGKGVPAVGKWIETDNILYRVSGVVEGAEPFQQFAYADMYVPYSVARRDIHSTDISGDYSGVILLRSAEDIPKMKAAYAQMAARVPLNSGVFDILHTSADSFLESYARGVIDDHSSESGLGRFFLVVSLVLFLFMLLPTLNLVNINISRIIERSSEIGVRKAFGASSKTLAYQFIVENLILTFIGNGLGLLLSYIILQLISGSSVFPGRNLSINGSVLISSLFFCLVFGLLSGVYPAWRMSKMPVVDALKA